VQAIARKLSEYQKRSIRSGNPGRAPDFGLVRDEVATLLAAGPVLRITTLQATTADGTVDANLEATIQVNDPAALQNPMFLMLALQASGNVSVPARLIDNTPLAPLVPGFVERGYIEHKQGQLKTRIRFRQGQLTLNGKVLQQ